MNASSESGVCPTEMFTILLSKLVIKNIRIGKTFQSNSLPLIMICANCENHKHFECIDCQNDHKTELCNCDCHLTEHDHGN